MRRRDAAALLGTGLIAAGLSSLGRAVAQEPPKAKLHAAAGTLRAQVVASGLHYPWSVVFPPGGDMLVSEKHPARLRRFAPDGTVSAPIRGLPETYAEGNGGLLGLALDPDFATTRRLYFAYSEPGDGETSALSVARAPSARRAWPTFR